MHRRPVLLVALALVALVLLARPAGAADGLQVREDTTYHVRPAASVVHAEATFVLRNTTVDQRTATEIRRRYFDGFALVVPVGATNVAATSDGRPVAVTMEPVEEIDAFVRVVVDLPALFSGSSRTVRVTYDIPGQPPRAEPALPINPAYAFFGTSATGDDGLSTVRISVPEGYEVETIGASMTAEPGPSGTTVYTSGPIADVAAWFAGVSVRNDTLLVRTPVSVGEAAFDLMAWPGDTAWEAFATDGLQRGLPVLEEIIGHPWPIDAEVAVFEAADLELRGYAGSYHHSLGRIEVTDQLDLSVLLHELAHGWFNRTDFVDRWVAEGLADEVAARAADEMDAEAAPLERPVHSAPGAVPLAEWYGSDSSTEVEAFAYPASRWVMSQVLDEIGTEGLATLYEAVDGRRLAYVGDGEPEVVENAPTWQYVVDQLQEVIGSEQIEPLVREWVVGPQGAAELDQRAEARAAYHELEEAGGAWAPPEGIRRAMGAWMFDRAEVELAIASDVLELRDELQAVAATAGLTLPASLESTYETTRASLGKFRDDLRAQLDAARSLAATKANADGADGPLERIGLLAGGVDGELAEVRAAFEAGDTQAALDHAAKVDATIEGAAGTGLRLLLLGLAGAVLVGGLVAGVVALCDRRRRRRPTPSAVASVRPVTQPDDEAVLEESATPVSSP